MPIEVTSDGFLPPDADDLATYLGITDIDTGRATLLIGLAVDRCEEVVSPLPDKSRGPILSAAARAYTNPTGETMMGAGPYQVARPAGNVYLTRSERRSLRLAAGQGGAFSIDLAGINGAGDATDYPDARFPQS